MKKYRFHLLGLVHLPQSKKYMSCAFTQKNRKLTKMLIDLGHEVFFYGGEGSDVIEYCENNPRLTFIKTHTLEDIRKDYGDGDNRFELGYDWTTQDFRHDFNKEKKPSTLKFYLNAIKYINSIKRPDDFLLCTQGNYHKPVADAVGLHMNCESGIGYRGSCASMFRCFESPYIQNFTYGSEHPLASIDGKPYDRVIPNYFSLDDVTFKDTKKDYYLFVGRVIKRKGILTAYETCKALGKKLIIAGQGAYIDERGYLVDNDPREFEIPNDSDWEYVGYADVEKRKELMANAIAVFTPTKYLECFAGVHIEAMLSGTPPITTDFGVYPYTIPDNLDGMKVDDDSAIMGYRCNTPNDFIVAANRAALLTTDHRGMMREMAEYQFSMENVAIRFQKWFDDLYEEYLQSIGK